MGGETVQSFSEWLAWAEPIAFGPLNMEHKDFEELQPHQFLQKWEGYCWRRKDKEDTFAYYVSHLMNISGKVLKKPIKAEELSRFSKRHDKRSKK